MQTSPSKSTSFAYYDAKTDSFVKEGGEIVPLPLDEEATEIKFTLKAISNRDGALHFDLDMTPEFSFKTGADQFVKPSFDRELLQKVLKFIANDEFLDNIEYILNKHPKVVDTVEAREKYPKSIMGDCKVVDPGPNDPKPDGAACSIVRQSNKFITRIVYNYLNPEQPIVQSTMADGDKPPK